MTEAKPRLLLLDGHSMAYRAFYALPPENFATASGVTTNAVYGFLSMLINTVRDEQPTHLAVAFDVSRQTFRSEQYPEYKANRAKSPPEFKPQIPVIQNLLATMAVPVVTADGFEADDVIATLARQALAQGFDVLIVTGDRDALQLVEPGITVLYPRKGVSDLARMTPDAVVEKYGVTPKQYADLAALRGDPSDNLPGIPGVGEKTAAKWILQFGSIDELIARADEVKGKVGEALRSHLDAVQLNRTLTALVDDVELDIAPADAIRVAWDAAAVNALLDELEIHALRDRLKAIAPDGTDHEAGAPGFLDDAGEELAAGEVATWLTKHAVGTVCAIDVVGDALHGTGRLEGLALATQDHAVWIDADVLTDGSAALTAVQDWAADEQSPKVVHNGNRSALVLGSRGVFLTGVVSDVELVAYLVAPDSRGYELAGLVRSYLKLDLPDSEQGQDQLSLVIDSVVAPLARARSRAILALQPLLQQKLESINGAGLLTDVELPVTAALVAMEQTGIGIDREQLADLSQHFDGQAQEAIEAAHKEVGHAVNLASPKQLQVVLFDELNMPKTKKTKTGFSTDAESLAMLFETTQNPFLGYVLSHREAAKLRSTVDGLVNAASADDRIRTTYMQTIAATGRLSSTDPNLQNIPVRTAEGRRIRGCFVVGPGFESLMTADYSQIEMRIMAHLSGDQGLIAAFISGEDLHTTVASQVFGVPDSEVDAEMRRKIKAMSYGLAYGLSAFGLGKQLNMGAGEAKDLMDEYFKRFGGVRDYLESVVATARTTGYTATVLGRRRYFPDLNSDNRMRREAAERMALNAPIQGSAADIIKVAMVNVKRAISEANLQSRLLLQVHDELVLEVAPGEREELEALVRTQMGAAYALDVPLDVSVGVGDSWDSAAH